MQTTTPSPARRSRPGSSTLARLGLIVTVMASSMTGALHVDAADPGVSAAPAVAAERSAASFEGRSLDLSKSWGDAQACWVDEKGSATCFRSEEQMDRALVAAGKDLKSTNPPTAEDKREGYRAATCSSSLRLYRNNSYGGGVLYLSQRGYWTNLSWYGFDNVVSSYRVGGCSTVFRSGTYGSGMSYWNSTSAWASRSSMSGWDNVLSSIYIY